MCTAFLAVDDFCSFSHVRIEKKAARCVSTIVVKAVTLPNPIAANGVPLANSATAKVAATNVSRRQGGVPP